jgi:plasmid stability protein
MPVDLSIKRVPDHLVERLRERAARNHRSLQGELMAMLESHVIPDRLTIEQIIELNRASGFRTPSESVEMIRGDRDDPLRGEASMKVVDASD